MKTVAEQALPELQ